MTLLSCLGGEGEGHKEKGKQTQRMGERVLHTELRAFSLPCRYGCRRAGHIVLKTQFRKDLVAPAIRGVCLRSFVYVCLRVCVCEHLFNTPFKLQSSGIRFCQMELVVCA